jgi:hypothetical protein
MPCRQRSAQRGLGRHDQTRPRVGRTMILGTFICVAASLRPEAAMADEREAILAVLQAYMAAVYARDYASAYPWIAEADRRRKSRAQYEQDHRPFTGASLVLARRLAREIVIREAVVARQGDRATVRTSLSLPDGNAEAVSRLLLAPSGVEEAPTHELEERMAGLEALIASGKLPRLEAEDTWTLVRDPGGWRVLVGGETL